MTDASQRSRVPAFAVCILVGALTILDLSGVNVALPSIQKSLDADSTQLQLIVAGYALAFGLSLVPSGRLGDTRSRRTMFMVGLVGIMWHPRRAGSPTRTGRGFLQPIGGKAGDLRFSSGVHR